jgi:hypothetical protein
MIFDGAVDREHESTLNEHDVHLTGTVNADRELLLDVGAPARPVTIASALGRSSAERCEELVEPRQDPRLLQQREVNVRGGASWARGSSGEAASTTDPRVRQP